jgi:DNA repair protein RecN (Recombination protein N)
MLRFLGIRRLAVIEELDVEFEPGLNLLTGETGAGKSILVGAIDLLMGGRASADLVRTGEESAVVQAIFERPDGREVIVRREISAEGRSRAFVDDALATAGALRELGASLVDLHGQHEHQALLDPAEHVAHLDAFLDAPDHLPTLAAAFEAWRAAHAALDRSRLDDREKRARIDMATFQLDEIEKVAPVAGEDERLRAERAVLSNADRLLRLSSEAYAALYDGEHAALVALAGVWKRVADLAVIDPRFEPYVTERDALKSSLEDLAMFLRAYTADLDASPGSMATPCRACSHGASRSETNWRRSARAKSAPRSSRPRNPVPATPISRRLVRCRPTAGKLRPGSRECSNRRWRNSPWKRLTWW